jgi:Holliday junction resolvase
MGKPSRDKGKRGEREVAQILRDRGIHHDRTLDGRNQVHGDILMPGMALEVRRREQVSIVRWSRDHEAEVPDHLVAAVAYRTNGEPWRVSLPLADLLDLLDT